MMGGRNNGKYVRNPCLTMHQPWASLLVQGIKRIEGRSWAAPIRVVKKTQERNHVGGGQIGWTEGRLWIHAAGKVPDDATIKAMEDFYREIYALNGIINLKFPDHYPVSRLIGISDLVRFYVFQILFSLTLFLFHARLWIVWELIWV
ncbi:unnamed protein product [Ilex paraguariensis]|uniref:ASCH domain-containing protein n=1 Tax=Ilex paraguariensis TaxID=185542 RepID=A0ABC8T5G2_9AQUA